MGKIKDTDLLLINRDGVDYNSPVEELSIPKKTSELDNDANFITLSEVPEPDLEGSLVFRGNVANEGALPGDAVVGDLYYNEDDQHLYARGESEWHKLGQIDDVNLDEYAKLDGSTPFTGQIQTAETGITFETTGYESELSITSYKAKGLCSEIVWGDKDGGEYGHVITHHFEGQDIRLKVDDAASTDTVLEVLTWGEVKATIDAQGTITAKEFIGDGSKLTNLPTGGDVDLDGYAKLDDAAQSITAKEFIGDGSKLTNLPVEDVDLDGYATEDWVEAKGYITADDLPEGATVADLPNLPD